MGKVPKPLTILLTDEEMLEWEVFKKMDAQGHSVMCLGHILTALAIANPHLVMGSKAAFLTKGMEKYVPIAVKAARLRAYPKKSGGKESGLDDE